MMTSLKILVHDVINLLYYNNAQVSLFKINPYLVHTQGATMVAVEGKYFGFVLKIYTLPL